MGSLAKALSVLLWLSSVEHNCVRALNLRKWRPRELRHCFTTPLCAFYSCSLKHKSAATDLIRVMQETCVRFRKRAADFEEPPRMLAASCTHCVALGRAFCCSRRSVYHNKCILYSSFSLLYGSSFWGHVNMDLSLLVFFERLHRHLCFCYQTCISVSEGVDIKVMELIR